MADIVVKKSALFSGGSKEAITIALATAEGDPLPETTPPLQLSIGASTNAPVKIGGGNEAKLALSADASAALTPIFSSNAAANAQQLTNIGAPAFFTNQNADQLLLLLELGANASIDATASPQQLQPLNASVELKAGVDSSYRYARSFAKSTPAKDVLGDFFTDLTVPASLNRPLHANEMLVFEFGGAASLGVTASAGYKIGGSDKFNLGDLALTETYAFSLLGNVQLNAQFAGRFSIDVRPATTGAADGWAHVRVRKNDKRSLGIAAQLNAGASFATQGLPATANEFLEAALGLRAKNWISYFQRAQQLTNPAEVKALLDKLGDAFIEKWLGKAFSALDTPEVAAVFAKIQAALASYDQLGDKAVTLFDRYYDPIAGAVNPLLQQALDRIAQLQSAAELKGTVLDGVFGEVLNILTEGKLLDLVNGGKEQLDKITGEVVKVKTLIDTTIPNKAHQELRDLIATAKKEFGLDKLANLLRMADPAKLKTIADERVTGFAERLIGKSVDAIDNSAIGKVAKEINETLAGIETFKTKFYAKLLDAVKQSFSLAINAGYNTARATDNLIECELNLSTAAGRQLVMQAGRANFAALLTTTTDPNVIRNIDGTLMRSISRTTTVSINFTGWHDRNWKFQSIRDMVVNAEQHVQSGPGGLMVSTNIDLTLSADRRRNGERLMTSFVLNVVGMSKGGAPLDPKTKQFLIDQLGAMKAEYALVREDPSTTLPELQEYLGLAPQLGFNLPDGAVPQLLPQTNGNFGKVTVTYNVQFTNAGLQAIFSKPVGDRGAWEQELRMTMRKLLLANYLGRPGLHFFELGWAYWSANTFALWLASRADVTQFIAPGQPAKTFVITGGSPIAGMNAPASVTLVAAERAIVDLLYRIEDTTVRAFSNLLDLAPPFSPAAYQNALAKFGNALDLYDRLDEGDNTILAVLDRLVQLGGVPDARSAQLTVQGTLNNNTVTRTILA